MSSYQTDIQSEKGRFRLVKFFAYTSFIVLIIFSFPFSVVTSQNAKDILMKILTSDQRVLKDPAPVVAVSELADSSVNLVCRPWVKPEDYWGVHFDTLEKGKAELEAAGITIPFPQRDVHLFEEKKAA